MPKYLVSFNYNVKKKLSSGHCGISKVDDIKTKEEVDTIAKTIKRENKIEGEVSITNIIRFPI